MKKYLSKLAIVTAIITALLYFNSCNKDKSISQVQFYKETDSIENELVRVKQNQKVMQHKIDSILQALNTLESNQQNILLRLDTLQAGQILIYSELTNEPEPSKAKYNFFDYAIEFLEK